MALSRQQRKYIAIERANRRDQHNRSLSRLRLKHTLEDIDWELDHLVHAVKELGLLEQEMTLAIDAVSEEEEDDDDQG